MLLSLAGWAAKDGTVTGHGVGGIRKDTGLGARTIRRALQSLGAAGWLTASAGGGREATFYTLHRHPLAKSRADTQTPPGGVHRPSPPGVHRPPQTELSDLSDPPGGAASAPPGFSDRHDQEDAMTTAAAQDPDQMGLELELEPVQRKTKARKDPGPAGRVVAAYCRSYVEHWQRQPASERSRVAGQVQALIRQGHTEEELVEAAEALGRTRFTALAEELRRVRDTAKRHDVEAWGMVRSAPEAPGYVEGW